MALGAKSCAWSTPSTVQRAGAHANAIRSSALWQRNTAEHSNDWIFDGHAFNLTVPGTYSSQHHCHSPWIRSYQHVRALSSLGAKIPFTTVLAAGVPEWRKHRGNCHSNAGVPLAWGIPQHVHPRAGVTHGVRLGDGVHRGQRALGRSRQEAYRM